jgi:predicted enzyme related to lactoylglutathione lyase
MTDEPSVFRNNSLTYLRIPAADPALSASFYERVFGWTIHHNSEVPSFTDGSGHMIGHFVTDQKSAGDDGLRAYIYTDDLGASLDAAKAAGAKLLEPPYPEGALTVATIQDPAGNTVGLWTS